jgi:hypothetical protein
MAVPAQSVFSQFSLRVTIAADAESNTDPQVEKASLSLRRMGNNSPTWPHFSIRAY